MFFSRPVGNPALSLRLQDPFSPITFLSSTPNLASFPYYPICGFPTIPCRCPSGPITTLLSKDWARVVLRAALSTFQINTGTNSQKKKKKKKRYPRQPQT
ncbi:UNVERIFIED_CONTAM: hypothetical protein K2H54_019524 [Gekko kuhli]